MELTVLGVSFTLLLLLGVPVAFAIGLSSVVTIVASGLPIAVVFQKMVGGMQVFSFLAGPPQDPTTTFAQLPPQKLASLLRCSSHKGTDPQGNFSPPC